jgi:hypothetical protein
MNSHPHSNEVVEARASSPVRKVQLGCPTLGWVWARVGGEPANHGLLVMISRRSNPSNQIFLLVAAFCADRERIEHAQRKRVLQRLILTIA